MDPFGNDEIARLLRLKRYEQPPASYYENFLSEFRRRQRDELLRQRVCRICFERARFRAPAQCPSLPCRRRGSGGVRRSDFNQDLSAARACSSRSRELACSNQVTEYRERIGLRASGFDSDVQWESDFSPCKQGYSVAAG